MRVAAAGVAAAEGYHHHRAGEEAEAEGCCRSQTCANPFIMSVMSAMCVMSAGAPVALLIQTLSDRTP